MEELEETFRTAFRTGSALSTASPIRPIRPIKIKLTLRDVSMVPLFVLKKIFLLNHMSM